MFVSIGRVHPDKIVLLHRTNAAKKLSPEFPPCESSVPLRTTHCLAVALSSPSCRLAPGGEWYAQSIIRFHERYWPQPIFGDDSMSPLPPISKVREKGVTEWEGWEDKCT